MGSPFHRAVLLVALVATACIYDARDTCEGDVCVNHPPVAVISDVGDDGALRVGNAGEVLISARDSNDPDGDVLSFLWDVAAPCTDKVSSALDVQDLRLDNLSVGAQCLVTLTVTDARNESASAQATLVVRNVGAHVSIAPPCIATFDPGSEAPQGTTATPFCSVGQALVAASTFHLGEIALDGGTHGFAGVMSLDFPVTLRGGYLRGLDAWAQSAIVATTLVIAEPPSGADATVTVVGGVDVGFAHLSIRRSGGCRADCGLVQALDSSLSFDTVVLGASDVITGTPGANDAAGKAYASVSILAPHDAAAPRHMTASDLTIYGSANAATSIGVFLDGVVDANLSTLEIHERAVSSVAVRASNARDILITDAVIDVHSAGGVGSQGFGIVDGNRETVSLAACSGNEVVCGNSRKLEVIGSTITVAGAEQVFGIDALGTVNVDVQSAVIGVDGQQAWGILTSGTQSTNVDGLNLHVTTRRYRAPIQAFAVGVSDNFEDGNAPQGGSSAFTVRNGLIVIDIATNNADQVGGINLVYTKNAIVDGNTVQITGESPAASIADEVAGIRMLGVDNVDIVNAAIEITNIKAVTGIAGIVDGDPNFTSGEPPSSSDLAITHADIHTDVVTNLLTLDACLILSGTQGASILGLRGIGGYECGVSGAATVYGVFTDRTNDVSLRETSVNVHGATLGTAVFGAEYVGFHDGGPQPALTGRASSKLVVTGNRFRMEQSDAVQIGVRLRGASNNAEPVIDDNFISARNGVTSVGVLLQHAHATVALNSIRLNGCSVGCSPSYAIGIYMLHTEDIASHFLGNVISVTSALDSAHRPAFVRHNLAVNPWDENIGQVDSTVFQSEVDVGSTLFLRGTSNDSLSIISPETLAGYTVSQVPGDSNVEAAPQYCPDGLHGTPSSPQFGAAVNLRVTFGTDLDGETRDVDTLDAGADAIAAVCPDD